MRIICIAGSFFACFLFYRPSIAAGGKNAGKNGKYNIIEFGAVAGGMHMNTQSIQRAIDVAHQDGGGQVIVPKGVFLTGSLVLKSGVDLHLLKGALVLGSANPRDYKGLGPRLALLLCDSSACVSITGPGTVDGQGLQLALAVDSLYRAGKLRDPHYDKRRMRPSTDARPILIAFDECSHVTISSVTIRNSSSWVQEYRRCRDLRIDHVNVMSAAYWNNDGMDICGCRNVRISNCSVNSADDGICLKTYSPAFPDSNIEIANCIVRSSASAIKFGTDSYGGFINIRIREIEVYDTYRSAIAIECVDGGSVNGVEVSDVRAENTGNAIFIRLGHRNLKVPAGSLKNVSIHKMKVSVPFDRPDLKYDLRGPALPFFHNTFPSSITGIPGHAVENVTLSNVEIIYPGRGTEGMAYVPLSRLNQVPEDEGGYPEFSMFGELPAWGLYVRHVDGLVMKHLILRLKESDYRPAFVFDDVSEMKLLSSGIQTPVRRRHEIALRNVRHGVFTNNCINNEKEKSVLELEKCDSVSVN